MYVLYKQKTWFEIINNKLWNKTTVDKKRQRREKYGKFPDL